MWSKGSKFAWISRPLERNDKFLDGLDKGLWRLQLVDDGLHVRFVIGVT